MIEQWGRQSGLLSQHKRDRCNSIARSIGRNRALTDSETETGQLVIDLLLEHNPGLLDEIQDPEPTTASAGKPEAAYALTAQLLSRLFEWEKKHKILPLRDVEFIKAAQQDKFPVGAFKATRLRLIIDKAARQGFNPNP